MDEVAPEEESPDPRYLSFQSIDDVDEFIVDQQGELMDINSEMIQYSRRAVRALENFTSRFNDIVNSIKEAHAIGAMMMSDLTTDMIMNEFGIESATEEEEEEEDE